MLAAMAHSTAAWRPVMARRPRHVPTAPAVSDASGSASSNNVAM